MDVESTHSSTTNGILETSDHKIKVSLWHTAWGWFLLPSSGLALLDHSVLLVLPVLI